MRVVLSLFALSLLMAPQHASAAGMPKQLGACAKSTISRIGGRLEGDTSFDTGTAVIYKNGGYQVSYDKEPAVVASKVGDPVRICLVELPKDCPPGDDRGKIYKTTNLRTKKSWTMPDAEHVCGGA